MISCAEDLPQHVALPRGCAPDVTEILREHGVTIDIDDQRTIGAELAAKFGGVLTSIQQQAADALLSHETGVLVAPPSSCRTSSRDHAPGTSIVRQIGGSISCSLTSNSKSL